MVINFDMDGTIADLYGVENWLESLRAENPAPYEKAAPMLRLSALARKLNNLQRKGHKVAIISWLSKNSSDTYDKAVTKAKLDWLKKHLKSVKWDKITIVPYGTPKQNYCESPDDVLFDDELKNRESWTGRAYNVENILETLKEI